MKQNFVRESEQNTQLFGIFFERFDINKHTHTARRIHYFRLKYDYVLTQLTHSRTTVPFFFSFSLCTLSGYIYVRTLPHIYTRRSTYMNRTSGETARASMLHCFCEKLKLLILVFYLFYFATSQSLRNGKSFPSMDLYLIYSY